MLLKKIDSIQFSLLSPQMIRKLSVIEIKTPETYDQDGYPIEEGVMDQHLGVINPGLKCKTCGQKMNTCPGHFGSLELVRPVIHSEFSKKIHDLLVASCQSCGRVALEEEELADLHTKIKDKTVDVPKTILTKTKKVKECPHCKAEKAEVLLDKPTNFYADKERIYPTQIREWLEKIPEHDLVLFNYNVEIVRPEWFVLTAMLIPPIKIRPSITLETGMMSEDDLTHKLVDIVRANTRLKDNIDAGAPQLIIEDLWDLLQYHVTTYFDNNTAGVPPAKQSTGRPLRTLAQKLKGKSGIFRYNLTGKRVNHAARSTVSPDAHLSIVEVGVPEEIANVLTIPEAVTEWNMDKIKEYIKDENTRVEYLIRPNGSRKKVTELNKEDILEELAPGFTIERKIRDGDIALFNRQPSLHKLSVMSHKVKIVKGRTLRINPIVCNPYNADFDGDEMNLHIPQSPEGITEAKELMFVSKNVINPRYGGPVVVPAEDGISAALVFTLRSTKIKKEDAMYYYHLLGKYDMPKPDIKEGKKEFYSGKLLFSELLPDDLNLEFPANICRHIKKAGKCEKCVQDKCPFDAYVKIKDGKLMTGVIDKASLGEQAGRIADIIARKYGPEAITYFYDNLSKISLHYLTNAGLTASITELTESKELIDLKQKAIKKELDDGEVLAGQFKDESLELVAGKNLEESFEERMVMLGAEVKDTLGKQIMSEAIDANLGDAPPLDMSTIIFASAKGNFTNLINMKSFWGQATVRAGRPLKGYKRRSLSHFPKGDIGALAGGFIRESFTQGLSPRGIFFHSIGARQGEVDTSVATKVSGYLYRRLANSLEDLTVKGDLSVRTSDDSIIQFLYGEDGISPGKAYRERSVNLDYLKFKYKK